jgi:hypothetical protein
MARSARWRNIAGNLALLLASVLVVLGVAEILARVDYARRRGKEQRERAQYTDSDPLLGWRMRPGARVQYHRTEYSIEVAINSSGLRDKERAPLPPAGALRILALGDSFVEGHTVEFPESVAQVMERDLSRPPCPVEVVNAGVGGYSTDQEYLYYRERGSRLGARIVVVFFYYNDVIHNARPNYTSFPKPLLAETDKGLIVSNLPLRPVRLRGPTSGTRPAFRGRSAAWEWTKERLLGGAPRAYQALARLGLWSPIQGQSEVPIEMKVYRRGPPPVIQEAWHMTDVILDALARETEARGARLLVVYVPSRMEVQDADWELTQMRFRMVPGRWVRDNVLRRLERTARERRFTLLDLTPALRRATGAFGRRVYFRYDGHWNVLGHRVAGEEVAAYLRREGWMSTCAGAP